MVSRNSSFSRLLFGSTPVHRPSAVAKATSFPAVILMSWKANATGFSDHDKNLSQVAM